MSTPYPPGGAVIGRGRRIPARSRHSAAPQGAPPTDTGGARLLFALCIMLLLFSMGRVGEVVSFLNSVPIAKLLMGLVVVTLVVARGRLLDFSTFNAAPLRLVIALFALCALSLLFSAWRSQTLIFVTGHLPILAMLVVLLAGAVFTAERLRVITLVAMFAGVPLALGASLEATAGRVKFGFTYDPNDLAYLLAALLPLLFARSQVTGSRLLRWSAYGAMAIYGIAAVLTQSRGGMIGIALMSIYIAWTGMVSVDGGGRYEIRSRGRWKRIGVLGVIGVAGIIAMPDAAKQRLGTIFDLSNDYNITATENDNGRLAIWKRGLSVLASRPWGVGANAYPIADYMAGGRYITAHNSTLQAFVELGVIGGTIFVAILVSTWRLAGRSRKRALAMTPAPEITELIALFTALRGSLIVVVVSGSFLSQAYGHILYVVVALCACAHRLLERRLEQSPEEGASLAGPHRPWLRANPIKAAGSR